MCPCFILKEVQGRIAHKSYFVFFIYLELRWIFRPSLAWQYINSNSFSGKVAAARPQWPRYQVSTDNKIKQINHNPAKMSLSSFVFSRLIQGTSSLGTTALFTACKRKIQPVIPKQAGRQSLMASDLAGIRLGAVCAAESWPRLQTGWWNEMTLRSLCEALLYGHVGENTGKLLDNSRVYLWAEGDVQEEQLWTGLEELLQGDRAHQAGTCQHKRISKGRGQNMVRNSPMSILVCDKVRCSLRFELTQNV